MVGETFQLEALIFANSLQELADQPTFQQVKVSSDRPFLPPTGPVTNTDTDQSAVIEKFLLTTSTASTAGHEDLDSDTDMALEPTDQHVTIPPN